MLQRVYIQKEETATFLKNKNMNASEFCNHEWAFNLAFLVDLSSQMNNLNLQLKEKFQLIYEMWSYVHALETKLQLWKNSIGKYKLYSLFYTARE